jgi:hypothetical protein
MSDTDKLEELDNENIQEEKTDESVENGGGNENREIDNHEEIDVHQETGDKLDEIDENKIEESEVNLSGKDENKDEEVDENKDGKIDENKDEKIDENKDGGEVGENKDGEVDENKDGEVDENEGEEEVEDEEGIDPNAIIENLEDRIESERYENELQEEHGDESEEKEEFPPQLKDEDEKEEEDYPNEAALIEEESDEKFREYIQHSLQEYNSILADNYDLQRKYATYLSNNPTDAVIGGTDDSDKTEDELKTDFYQQLSTIENLREEGAAINNSVNEILQNLKNQVINKKQELENVLETFNQYKRQVALQSRNSKNGLGLEKNDVEQLIAREAEKDKEINERRLRNITLQNKLNKMGDKESV